MAYFKLRKLWEDHDGMVRVELSVSDDRQGTTQDFYTYPEHLEAFGRDLAAFFPKLGKGEVIFEYGEEAEKVYSFVFVKAFYINIQSTGVIIQTNNNKTGHESVKSKFCIESSLSEVNKLGVQIAKWAKAMQEPLTCELK